MKEPKQSSSGFETYFATKGVGKTTLSLKKNAVIYSQGDPSETIFYIQKGRVKLHVISDHGKEAVVAIMEAGQFFGEGCLNGDTARVATAVSLGDSAIVSISKHAMREALKNEPSFAQLFVTYLITRTSRVEEDLIDQLFNSSEKRLARLLLLLAHFGKEGVPQPIDIEISQETLAEMIGTTRSRVSHFMHKFRKLGFISYNGKIHVHNSLLNAVLHEKPALRTNDMPAIS
jgi:CRP/FNR family cyclic AMP-dependent transcriptional regulator